MATWLPLGGPTDNNQLCQHSQGWAPVGEGAGGAAHCWSNTLF